MFESMFKREPLVEVTNPDGSVTLTAPCVFTNEEHSVTLDRDQYHRYTHNHFGAPIQDVLPEVTIDIREFLATGVSPKGWDKHIPEEEE